MTKSINQRRPLLDTSSGSLCGILCIYVILVCTTVAVNSTAPPSCGLYGAPPCQFLPAPPGQTPNCARPGKTYCEHVENYPTYLIKSLVRKWGYEAATLLVDETWETFETVAWQHTPVFYDPKSIFRPPGYGQDFNGYSYQTPFGGSNAPQQRPATGNSLFPPHQANPQAATEGPTFLLYTSNGAQRPQQQSITSQLWAGKTTPYNATIWLKRLVRDVSLSKKAAVTETETETESVTLKPMKERSTRDVSLNMDLLDIVGVKPNDKQTRTKRQSSSRSTLCETTSQFITPQAALNSHGNWMFVVNEENTARQMVKAELCASNTCSNLCDLPNGYNSRCEQKFVQKRLIALQGNGQNLYTDTFWFPSCCVCTIAAN